MVAMDALVRALNPLLEDMRKARLWPKNIRARCIHKHWKWMGAIRELQSFQVVEEQAGAVVAERRNLVPVEVATWLAWRAARRSPNQAVSDALSAVEADEFDAMATVVLSGPQVLAPAPLDGETSFMSFKDLPWSFEKVDYRPRKFDVHDGFRVLGPTAALCTKQAVTWEQAARFPVDESMAMDFVRCLTLASRKPTIPIVSWQQHGLEVPLMRTTSFVRQVPADIIHPASGWKVTDEQQANAVETFTLLRAFNQEEIGRLRIGLDRLGRGAVLGNLVNKAIDLGIGAEALLVDGRGGNTQQVAQKAAWLIAPGDAKHRAEIEENMKDFYDVRSTAVHTGKIGSGKRGRTAKDILEEGTQRLTDVAWEITRRGSFPTWTVTQDGQRRLWRLSDAGT